MRKHQLGLRAMWCAPRRSPLPVAAAPAAAAAAQFADLDDADDADGEAAAKLLRELRGDAAGAAAGSDQPQP